MTYRLSRGWWVAVMVVVTLTGSVAIGALSYLIGLPSAYSPLPGMVWGAGCMTVGFVGWMERS